MFTNSPLQITKFLNSPRISYDTVFLNHEFSQDIYYTWKLQSNGKIKNFTYHILPDGCIDVILQRRENILMNPIISQPFSTYFELELCDTFDFIGIKFKPGKFRKYFDVELNEISDSFISLDLHRKEFTSVEDFLHYLKNNSHKNPLTYYQDNVNLLMNSYLSERQKRRLFIRTTGFNIRDYKNIKRFQNVISDSNNLYLEYFDQSHFINSFKKMTGFTPSKFFENFQI